MALKSFPKALYKGDSVAKVFKIKDKRTGEYYEFQVGDIVQLGIKQTLDDENFQVIKEFTVTQAGTELMMYLSPQETDALTVTEEKGILEARLIYNDGASRATVYQQGIRLEGVVVDE